MHSHAGARERAAAHNKVGYAFSFLVSRFSFLVSRFSFLVSRFSFLVSRFSFLISRFSLLASRFSLLASRFSLLASRFSFLSFPALLRGNKIVGLRNSLRLTPNPTYRWMRLML